MITYCLGSDSIYYINFGPSSMYAFVVRIVKNMMHTVMKVVGKRLSIQKIF